MSRPKRMAPSLAANWDRVAAQIRASKNIVVFLDFDGTLVNFAPGPDQVRLSPAARRILRRLERHPRVTLVVISGRRRSELQHHIGLRGIQYHGLYGWEDGSRPALPEEALTALRNARLQLSIHLASVPGFWVEEKHFTLSAHFLHVPRSEQAGARRKLRSLLRPFRSTLRLIENLRDTEIVPLSVEGKGSAVRRFLAQPAHAHSLAICFGDDFSDESLFEAVGKGISVRVGPPRPTQARYSIRNPAAVAATLAKIEAVLT